MNMASLRRILLFSRDVEAAAAWYAKLGLRLTHTELPAYAQLDCGPLSIDLQHTDNESQMCAGYSPILHFEVPNGIDALIPALLMAGGRMDGAIQYTAVATVVSMRSPDGHMISISEPNAEELR